MLGFGARIALEPEVSRGPKGIGRVRGAGKGSGTIQGEAASAGAGSETRSRVTDP